MLAYAGIGVGGQFFERLTEACDAAVSHGGGDVSKKAGILGPKNGAVGEHGPEIRFLEGSEAFEGRSEVTRREAGGVLGVLGILVAITVPELGSDAWPFRRIPADPEGILWEIAWNPGFPIDENGRIEIP